ncbi:MAG: lipopolysaccharide heptosyltransferase II [Thermogutta sp.]
MNICIFLPNWLGDLVMAVPALRAIRQGIGESAWIVGITRPNLAGLLTQGTWIDEEWYFDPHGDNPRFGTVNLIRKLRDVRWDVGILFSDSFRTALLAVVGGIPVRIGYARHGRRLLLTQPIPLPRMGGKVCRVPMVDYYLRLGAAAGFPSQDKRLELSLSPWGTVCADRIWHDLSLNHADRIVAMHVAGAYGAAKSWPAPYFVELARKIVAQTTASVLFVCGQRERATVQAITREVNNRRVVCLADHPLDLQTLKACLARCHVMVSTDSGPRHVAAALGKPVITLFGPTWPIVTANPTVQSIDLQVDLDCVPCGRRTCPKGHHRCMWELSPEMVFSHLQPLLTEQGLRGAA